MSTVVRPGAMVNVVGFSTCWGPNDLDTSWSSSNGGPCKSQGSGRTLQYTGPVCPGRDSQAILVPASSPSRQSDLLGIQQESNHSLSGPLIWWPVPCYADRRRNK